MNPWLLTIKTRRVFRCALAAFATPARVKLQKG